ncbi:hypothetical protein K504DRAFT_462332 [Pleomassaria siparia CBS 279.74]|uniref:Uncharacterized protein n=1 Tax=Pleomassaria siparia CBS 279.74 TaxID=1314801 RepID=A0A6G1KM19_9PLEO|nr:hypothetical protein K504DRAFT_462332 [Pleomassaria siparia CBS 279.74]
MIQVVVIGSFAPFPSGVGEREAVRGSLNSRLQPRPMWSSAPYSSLRHSSHSHTVQISHEPQITNHKPQTTNHKGFECTSSAAAVQLHHTMHLSHIRRGQCIYPISVEDNASIPCPSRSVMRPAAPLVRTSQSSSRLLEAPRHISAREEIIGEREKRNALNRNRNRNRNRRLIQLEPVPLLQRPAYIQYIHHVCTVQCARHRFVTLFSQSFCLTGKPFTSYWLNYPAPPPRIINFFINSAVTSRSSLSNPAELESALGPQTLCKSPQRRLASRLGHTVTQRRLFCPNFN